MALFKLDNRLANDCVIVGSLPLSELLLMNNREYPWFILVPRCEVVELHELTPEQQLQLLREYNALASFVSRYFAIDKLNTGALGNIVRQLHLHVVGRREDDACWPGPVWGCAQGDVYSDERLTEIKRQVNEELVPQC
jgi:diadenosine tetraphosphate (Ap4A) HIT family hydrolase